MSGEPPARPSRDIPLLAHQQATRDWWDRRADFDLYVSEVIIVEVSAGDPGAAGRRLDFLAGLPILASSPQADGVAIALFKGLALPSRAAADAQHIAIAVVNGVDTPLTWNGTHIANATFRARIEAICRAGGFSPTIICTPPELPGKA